jgi:hypothetical protein
MKNMIKLPAALLGLMLLFGCTTQQSMAQGGYDNISLQSFYDELSPYGTWIQDPEYGNVWRPDVDQDDFRPYYTDGRWAMTEYGNTWVSDYDWGWAPFHYGRWVNNRFNQWVWIPDTVWGPAWVSWRSGGGYYGWAPLGPGINININIGGGGYNTPSNWWNFIPQHSIYSNNYPRYSSRNITIINRTTIINNIYGRGGRNTYYTGPRADEIRRVTNRDVRVYNVSRSDRPGRTSISNNNINIYNPRSGSRSDNGSPRTGNSDRPGRGSTNMSGRSDVSNSSRTGNPFPARRGDVNTTGRPDVANPSRTGNTFPSGRSDINNSPRTGNTGVRTADQSDRTRSSRTGNTEWDQQRQQQQRQQQDQQRQQQDQQRQQQQRQQQDQQRQQQDQQRQQQQRQQQDQQRQQQDQQRQQQQRQQESRSSGGDASQRSQSSRSGRN